MLLFYVISTRITTTNKEKWKISPFSFILMDKRVCFSHNPSCYYHHTMYTEYFGLKERPFTISPDPRYLYMSEYHREALAHLLYGINSKGCLILLTGDVGTGKTTVCRSLVQQLPEDTETAIIINPKLSVQELLETICEELAIAHQKDSDSVKSYIDAITSHLLRSHAAGKTTVLIIDEAQNLDMEVLEQLRLLTNLETDTEKLLQIVLIGQPELTNKLKSRRVTQISQRITSRYHLAPLNRQDTYSFIRHRLIIAGGGRMQFFTQSALQRTYQLSGGIPRLINVLCDRALLGAYAEGSDQVTGKILIKAGWEILGQDSHLGNKPPSSRLPVVAACALLVLCLGSTAMYFFYKDAPSLQHIVESFISQPQTPPQAAEESTQETSSISETESLPAPPEAKTEEKQ